MQVEYRATHTNIANNVRLLRKAYGRSRACLAKASGVTVAEVTALECGLMRFTSARIHALAHALEVSTNMLLSDPGYVRRFVKWSRSRRSGD